MYVCTYLKYVRCATMIDMSDDYCFVILVHIEAIFMGSSKQYILLHIYYQHNVTDATTVDADNSDDVEVFPR